MFEIMPVPEHSGQFTVKKEKTQVSTTHLEDDWSDSWMQKPLGKEEIKAEMGKLNKAWASRSESNEFAGLVLNTILTCLIHAFFSRAESVLHSP